jgi:hypothetical protein
MRSNPHLPLATPEADSEAVRRKGKSSAKGVSIAEIGNAPSPSVRTPLSYSQLSGHPSSEVPRCLNFRSVPAEFSPPGLVSEGEILVTPPSLEYVSRPLVSKDFTTPPVITTAARREASAYSGPLDVSLFFPSSPVRTSVPTSPTHTPSPLGSPLPNIPMAGANPPLNRMDAIVAARYAPLVLPHPMNPLPAGDYLKYMPKFTRGENLLHSYQFVFVMTINLDTIRLYNLH